MLFRSVGGVCYSQTQSSGLQRQCSTACAVICCHPALLQHVHDEVVHLIEHHKVHGQTGAAVLCGRVTGQPGEGVVLLQHKSDRGEKG